MPENIVMMLLWYAVFLFSLVVHEASHAWASLKLGDDTAYEGGQVTLDPRPHMQREPLGTILVPLVSYFLNGWMMGWASAPYDPRWAMNNPRASGLVSLAGPLANLGVVIACAIIIRAGVLVGIFHPPDYMNFMTIVSANQDGIAQSAALMLSILFSLNVLLFAFNLLPFPPLDGSGILTLFFRNEESAVKYMEFINNPTLYLLGIFAAWHLFGYIFYPIHTVLVNGLYWGVMSY